VAIGSIHCNTRQSVTGAQKSVTNYRLYHNMEVLQKLKKVLQQITMVTLDKCSNRYVNVFQ
jgi:hypothetical protein